MPYSLRALRYTVKESQQSVMPRDSTTADGATSSPLLRQDSPHLHTMRKHVSTQRCISAHHSYLALKKYTCKVPVKFSICSSASYFLYMANNSRRVQSEEWLRTFYPFYCWILHVLPPLYPHYYLTYIYAVFAVRREYTILFLNSYTKPKNPPTLDPTQKPQ